MNLETQLKIQAYVDGELPESEARTVANLVAHDPEAKAAHQALFELKRLIMDNEPDVKLTENREFYWSKIERAISCEPSLQPALGIGWLWGSWMRLAASFACIAMVLLAMVSFPKLRNLSSMTAQFHEIETPFDEGEEISFQSESAKMTVIWVASARN